MTERSVTHTTFVIERFFQVSPARVFAAWSTAEQKRKWFGCHEGATHELDFRVGGHEMYRGGPKGGPIYMNETRFQDIVPNQRIVYTYDMHRDETRISVSLVTIELKAEGKGTRLVFTEQGAFLDGHDAPEGREHGTKVVLDKLVEGLEREAHAAA
ncbi:MULTISPECIES: SRPBCC family protein [Polyangium]|uniref:Polyketide cyclase n=2 Tax=Polyangium TaxID=55 RepID=A0A4U1JHL2_9BACT|nr:MULTISPECIES: SRPBCC family protein [Polyangium]MDI1428522.1 SRPBCC family protein [Polyangium sorediatum]TKD11890.1 polyketide cyclase [Polyangium fumosum]